MLRRLRLLWAPLALLCLFLALPAGAGAAIKTIASNPLTVHLDSRGNVQVQQFGQSSFSFYNPGTTVGDAGFYLGFPVAAGPFAANSTVGPGIQAGSPDSANYTEVSSDPVTGNGSAATPYTQVTKYSATGVADIIQTTTYVTGARSFNQKWEVKNVSGASLRFRASVGADLYLEGSDQGVGFFDAGPPRTVGGLSQATGRAGGLREVATSPWSNYQEAAFSAIWNIIRNSAGTSSLNNTIVASALDNGVAAQWDTYRTTGLTNGTTATFETQWQFGIAGLTASPPSALLGKGSFHQVTFTATDDNGALAAGKTLRYTIAGANPSSGAKTTFGNGQAPVGWVGNNAGTDTVTAYLDLDNNGVKGANEPQAAANARFVDPTLPSGLSLLTLSGIPIVQNGVTTLVIVVPSAGRLSVQQAGPSSAVASAKGKKKKAKKKKAKPALIKKVTLNPTKAGPVKVKIKPSKRGKKLLAKKGKFNVKIKITFKPKAGGKTLSFTKTVKMKGKKKAKARHKK